MKLSDQNIWLNFNKPQNMTSAHLVAIVKRLTRAKKVGHGGTLDPMATGVLPIALNKATKTSEKMMGQVKKYFFRIKWGEFRDSDDAQGEIIEISGKRPKTEQLIAILPHFLGKVSQIPSKFSAIRVNGVRAYELARQGVEFELKSREIEVFSIKMAESNKNFADFEVKCSKGTYIRTLAHDIAKKLGVCGHVCILRRVEVGEMRVKNSLSLANLKSAILIDSKIAQGGVFNI